MSYTAQTQPGSGYSSTGQPLPPPTDNDSLLDAGLLLRELAAQSGEARLAAERQAADRPQDIDQQGVDHEPFYPVASLELPAVGAGGSVVLSFTVPAGYDGAISAIGHVFTGGGFTTSAGDIVWRLRRSGQYFRNFENMTAEFGDVQNPTDLDGSLRIFENEIVEYVVEHVSEVALAGDIVCKLRGRIWPRR